MKPELSATIFAARELAWESHVNLSNRKRYAHRNELHQRLVDALTRVSAVSANASPELRYLVEAIYRAAACSWANRMGLPYYERKEAVAQLRGCLLAYDRSLAPASRPGRDFVEATLPGVVPSRRRGRIGTPEPMPARL